jgi:hypothetical protein
MAIANRPIAHRAASIACALFSFRRELATEDRKRAKARAQHLTMQNMANEQHSENINTLSEMLDGLSEAEAILVLQDIGAFGHGMVHVVNGIKHRIPPHEWVNNQTRQD